MSHDLLDSPMFVGNRGSTTCVRKQTKIDHVRGKTARPGKHAV